MHEPDQLWRRESFQLFPHNQLVLNTEKIRIWRPVLVGVVGLPIQHQIHQNLMN